MASQSLTRQRQNAGGTKSGTKFSSPIKLPPIKNPATAKWLDFLGFFGRDGVIRTLDPLHPMQVRYQAALRPDCTSKLSGCASEVSRTIY